MNDIRDSFSRTRKRLGYQLTGRKYKPDGTGTNPSGESVDSTTSLPQPDPHVVAGESDDQEGAGVNAAGECVLSTDRHPQPDRSESVLAYGSDNAQEGGEESVDGGGTSQVDSYSYPDVEVAVGSGHNGEPEEVYPSPSHGGRLDSTRTFLFRLLPLIVPSDNADTPALPDYEPGAVRPDETLELTITADGKKSNCKSTASATAELLRGVRDSAGAFGPLKTVARSLCFVLDNCEVWPPSRAFDSRCSRSF